MAEQPAEKLKIDSPDARTIQAVCAFSVELLKELSGDEPKNLIVSPVSVSILLAMVHQGARNNSASQLETVLHLTQQESRHGYGAISSSFKQSNDSSAIVEVANRFFLKRGLELQQEFRDVAVQDFQSGVEEVTFGTGEGATVINNWVSDATHGRIPSIVEPRLDEDTSLVLANAIFFKCPWQKRFKEHLTTNELFSVRPKNKVSVRMMHHYNKWLRAGVDEERKLKWVQLPFKDDRFSMVIIVPDETYGLEAVLRNFNGDTLDQLLEAGSSRTVHLHMPRFKLSSVHNLEEPLQQLGARDIFDRNASDLSGIVRSSQCLFVSKTIQKADIEVDENGATAAAVTEMRMRLLCGYLPFNPVTITANRPFIAVLVDHAKRIPLFLTTVVDPSEQ